LRIRSACVPESVAFIHQLGCLAAGYGAHLIDSLSRLETKKQVVAVWPNCNSSSMGGGSGIMADPSGSYDENIAVGYFIQQ